MLLFSGWMRAVNYIFSLLLQTSKKIILETIFCHDHSRGREERTGRELASGAPADARAHENAGLDARCSSGTRRAKNDASFRHFGRVPHDQPQSRCPLLIVLAAATISPRRRRRGR